MTPTIAQTVAAALIVAASVFYAFIGLNAIARPRRLLKGFDLIAETPEARNEIRGIYGGMPLALSAVLLSALVLPNVAIGILIAVATLTAGMAVGRLVSAAIDQSFGSAPRFWCAAEIAVASALALAAWLC